MLAIAPTLLLLTCERPVRMPGGETGPQGAPPVVIHEVMVDPRTIPDERGEWFEVRNVSTRAMDLRGWTIASGNDAPHTISRSVPVAGGGMAVLAVDAGYAGRGGPAPAYVYPRVALGNRQDWLAIRAPDGGTVDSVAWSNVPNGASRAVRDAGLEHVEVAGANWTTSTSTYGSGDRGTPGSANDEAVAPSPASLAAERASTARSTTGAGAAGSTGPVASPQGTSSELVVRVLDVGQGDAILVSNGGSHVLIDGGPDPSILGRHLDRNGLNGETVDAVILTHQHSDHHGGLRELFRSRRRIAVRYWFENLDAYTNESLSRLRDSVRSRAGRGELVVRDTDDPCGTGAPTCTITMRGGARLHVLRPDPRGASPNDRSTAVKIVGPDSASFTMWLAGDAERDAITWFDQVDYDRAPGMEASVLKADHHGSCDGLTRRYLDLVRPRFAVISLAARNDYGYVHRQTTALLRGANVPWYRTDQNGTVTIRSPGTVGGGFAVEVERGAANASGPMDRAARCE